MKRPITKPESVPVKSKATAGRTFHTKAFLKEFHISEIFFLWACIRMPERGLQVRGNEPA
jgi:hypothetical protein